MNYGSKSCNIVYGLQAGREPIFLRLSLSLIVLMLILLVIFITTTVILVRYKTRIQRKPDQLVRESTREETTTYEDINLTQLGGIDTSENIAYGHLSSRHVWYNMLHCTVHDSILLYLYMWTLVSEPNNTINCLLTFQHTKTITGNDAVVLATIIVGKIVDSERFGRIFLWCASLAMKDWQTSWLVCMW